MRADLGRHDNVKALWVKVIIRAVFDWVTFRETTKLPQRSWAEDSYRWMFRPSVLFNSFENVCFYLDIDPDKVRTWAKALTPEQVVKIEHLERDSTKAKNSDIISILRAR